MDEKSLQAAIKGQISNAVGFLGGEISDNRRIAMRDYLGEPMGNEIEGRSQVVSSDVQDTIEAVMPDLIQIFTSSDKAVQFEPIGQEDEASAEQSTEYVNHIWNVDNPGFNLFYDWFKDALLQKNGIVKIWFDTSEKTERRKYTKLSDDALALLMGDEYTEVVEHTEYWPHEVEQLLAEFGLPADAPPETLPPEIASARLHDVTIIRRYPCNRVRVENVPPEEFLISRRARTLQNAPFTCHRTSTTVSDLIRDGYDPEQVKAIPSGNDEFNDEKQQRFNDEDGLSDEEADLSMREITVHECYLNVDWDGDGIAELRKVTVAGPSFEILKFKDGGGADNEEIDSHPFAAVTPVRMPHKFFGRSLAELVQDIQAIKTAVWRQVLDNMYNVNNARAAVSTKVSLDDYLDNKVGSPIRVDTAAGDVGGHITPIVTASIGNHAFPLLEYLDVARETRTGVNRLGQGLDPDALRSTASGINQLLGRSQQRTLLIAMVFAYGGVRDAFRKILKLVVENQDKPRTIRLRNKWVEIDPRSWNAEMDVTVNVGLGRGTQDQQIATTAKIVESTNGLVALQGGVSGPFVFAHHVRNAYAKLYEAVGLRNADPYLAPLGEQESAAIAQSAGEQPNPEMMKIELDAQDREAKNQIALSKEQMTHMRELLKIDKKEEAEQARLDLQAAIAAGKFNIDREKLFVTERTKRISASSKSGANA